MDFLHERSLISELSICTYYRSSSAIGRIRDKWHRFAFDRSLTKICNTIDNIIP